MSFGTRVSIRQPGPAVARKETCTRCYGTGWVRERGSKIVCKPCAGTGRVDAKAKHAS
jgi:DnaJ-class molecular chaperone